MDCKDLGVVDDPSLEASAPNPYWTELPDAATGPLCEGSCSSGTPFDGSQYALFGVGGVEGSIEQAVTIPVSATRLTYWVAVTPALSGPSYNELQVLLDGKQIDSVPGLNNMSYTERTVDIVGVADGLEHTLTFANTVATHTAKFTVDLIQIQDCIITPTPSPTPSPTPTPTPDCSASKALLDGGFEEATSPWSETLSANAISAFCPDSDCRGGPGAYAGSGYLWLGRHSGSGILESVLIEQDVRIPTNATTLAFYMTADIPDDDGTGNSLAFAIDNTTLTDGLFSQASFRLDRPYTYYELDCSAYADGGIHTIQIVGNAKPESTTSNVLFGVDAMELIVCTTPTPTPSPTPSPAPTEGPGEIWLVQ